MCILTPGLGTPCSIRKAFNSFMLLFRDFQLTFDRIDQRPDLNFTVVVNPASGPGAGLGPDGNYTRDIPRLNSYANVRTVGYVSTSWTNREVALVLKDIMVYSVWAENTTTKGLGMHGIFLDETPALWSATSAQFLEIVAKAIRSEKGFGLNPLVSHVKKIFSPAWLLFRRYQMLSSCCALSPVVKRHCYLSCQSGPPRLSLTAGLLDSSLISIRSSTIQARYLTTDTWRLATLALFSRVPIRPIRSIVLIRPSLGSKSRQSVDVRRLLVLFMIFLLG